MKMFLIGRHNDRRAALAQTAAPADAHSGHSGHATPASQSPANQHTGHSMPGGQGQADPHAGHDMPGGMMDCCKKDGDGKMACCKQMAGKESGDGCCAGQKAKGTSADPHASHDMSRNAHAGDAPNKN